MVYSAQENVLFKWCMFGLFPHIVYITMSLSECIYVYMVLHSLHVHSMRKCLLWLRTSETLHLCIVWQIEVCFICVSAPITVHVLHSVWIFGTVALPLAHTHTHSQLRTHTRTHTPVLSSFTTFIYMRMQLINALLRDCRKNTFLKEILDFRGSYSIGIHLRYNIEIMRLHNTHLVRIFSMAKSISLRY